MVAPRAGFGRILVQDFRSRDPTGPWVEWIDVADPRGEHPWLPPDAMYVGRTILELAGVIGSARARAMRVLLTWFWTIDAVLPFSGDDVIVFCLGDESGRKPSYSHDVALVAKTNGATRRPYLPLGPPATWPALLPALLQEMRGQLRIAPGASRAMLRTIRLRRRARILEVPSGTFWLSAVPFVPMGDRRYDISFAGSMMNEGQDRTRMLAQKTRSRLEMLTALREVRRALPDLCVEVTTFDVFSDVEQHREGFSERMMQTRLALCPRGGSRETYRVFEAAASGCIPITEKLPRRPYFDGCPAVQLRSWSRLPKVVGELLADEGALGRRQEAVLAWWNAEAAPGATAARIGRVLDRKPRAIARFNTEG